jgi:hypothetical protein
MQNGAAHAMCGSLHIRFPASARPIEGPRVRAGRLDYRGKPQKREGEHARCRAAIAHRQWAPLARL